MAKYLLDTHILIWANQDRGKLSQNLINILSDNRHEFFISMASIWEMQLKIQNKKLDIVPSLGCVLYEIELKNLYTILPIKKEYIQNLEFLPFYHKDPFDRMLVSQAMLEGLTILTVDEHIMKYRIKVEN
ncbi:PIN domain [Moraxella lacunata]|uniref:PIN domain n=1 Tax=Moraxella lacunata TaxID=477 RepID=A0A378T645_MORLA|nr:type II toxin-antitoxin system VapC family toxin [Moraxella lacunata]STZ55864.1 PIN domain [Moraxella lacunata]